MRRRVSGETLTTNCVGVKEVTVRHVPLMLMLSPSWASERMDEHSEMVRVVLPSEEGTRPEMADFLYQLSLESL